MTEHEPLANHNIRAVFHNQRSRQNDFRLPGGSGSRSNRTYNLSSGLVASFDTTGQFNARAAYRAHFGASRGAHTTSEVCLVEVRVQNFVTRRKG